ncbi:LSU ribosomal protein L9P [Anaerobranca californiensis DSM 14826]|jgi:large subunit ribosomal protein L9|uniref:Large ribosomal subunit protein bL9 n=1 Tax=Anaerobranca californiensis DSM 14826 TaxID=1120989 RepID=A0A1M6M463_9FIRM|nr:50S ribosomal protein L9 [Anaerobranca californiensis]SHJ78176.1 LSU ribosomal protein L9P [Anaerobranca californiensis DSM 14826]
MKVIMLQTVKKVGKQGEIIEVSEGYARNFLIPKGYAVEASKGNVKVLDDKKQAEQRKKEKELKEAKEYAEKISNIKLEILTKAGEGGKLFGSVTSKEIASLLADKGIKVDKRKIELPEPIKSLGEYNIPIKLHREVTATVKLVIIPQ